MTTPDPRAVWWKAFGLGVFAALALGSVPLIVVGAGDSDERELRPVVVATEFAFDPPDLALPAAEAVTVELTNDGATVHNWTVLSEAIAVEADFDSALVLGGVPDVNGGETGASDVTLDAGEYQVICTIAGHFDAGMEGSVTAQ